MVGKGLIHFLSRIGKDHAFRREAAETGAGPEVEAFAARHGFQVDGRELANLALGLSEDGQVALGLLESDAVEKGLSEPGAQGGEPDLRELLSPEEHEHVVVYLKSLR